jgi:hypothetical protein
VVPVALQPMSSHLLPGSPSFPGHQSPRLLPRSSSIEIAKTLPKKPALALGRPSPGQCRDRDGPTSYRKALQRTVLAPRLRPGRFRGRSPRLPDQRLRNAYIPHGTRHSQSLTMDMRPVTMDGSNSNSSCSHPRKRNPPLRWICQRGRFTHQADGMRPRATRALGRPQRGWRPPSCPRSRADFSAPTPHRWRA